MTLSEYKDKINKEGVIVFVPIGSSMWPTLKDGKQSVVVVKNKDRLKIGDIALFVREDGVGVLHRVIEVKEDGYVFCGDSTEVKESIKEDLVVGIMAGFYKGKKYIDARDEKFVKKYERLYKDEKKRVKKSERYLKFKSAKNKIKKMFGLNKKG